MQKKVCFVFVIIFLQTCVFFGFSLMQSIPSKNSIRTVHMETNMSLKTSSNEQFERFLDEFRVNYNTTNNQNNPSICALSEDKIAVAWMSELQDSSAYGIYARVFNAITGENITAEFRVNYNTTSNQNYPSICALSEDKIAVAWASYKQDGDENGVYARVFNAITGENITAEFRVNYNTINNQYFPSICALSEDKIAVAWASNLQDLSGYGVYARIFNATTGENITAEFRVNYYTTNSQFDPSICALSEDKIAVAWTSDSQDLSGDGVYARVFNAITGENITAEFRVNYYTTNHQARASICALSEDKIAVAWESNLQDLSGFGVYARVFNAITGENITAEFRVNYNTTSNQNNPSICALFEDKIAVAWMSDSQDLSGFGVYARVFNAITGENITAEFRINYNTTNNQNYPSICALSEDKIAVAWMSELQDLSGDGVYASVFGFPPQNAIIIPIGGDDDDDDDEDSGAIPGYDLYVLFIIITLSSLVLITKLRKN